MVKLKRVRRGVLALCMLPLLFVGAEACTVDTVDCCAGAQARVVMRADVADANKEEGEEAVPRTPLHDDFEYSEEIPLDADLQRFVWGLCEQYGIERSVVYGIMYHESRFEPDVVSATGDYGLMQINTVNHAWLSEKLGRPLNFLDSRDNVEAGICFLSTVLKDDLIDTLMVYSLGETGAVRARERGVHRTRCVEELVRDVMHFREVFSRE